MVVVVGFEAFPFVRDNVKGVPMTRESTIIRCVHVNQMQIRFYNWALSIELNTHHH